MPLLSIIIPTCNRNDLLAQCLQRLQPGAQTLDAALYEVIVSDDSPNNEAEGLIQQQFPWASYTPGPKRGPAANRNNGARLAAGKWLVFLDDDCLPDDKLLEAYLCEINQEKYPLFEGSIKAEGQSSSPLDYAPINETGGSLLSCNFCISKYLFNNLSGFDEDYLFPHMEDIDLKCRINKYVNEIPFLPQAIVVHPWRKITSGFKLGYNQEMYVLYRIKYNLKLSKYELLKSIVSVHIAILGNHKISFDYFKSILFCIQHLYIVFTHFNKWKKKYVGKY